MYQTRTPAARAFQPAFTRQVYSPLHRRAWNITEGQWRLLILLRHGRRTTQRELAELAGYRSVHGAHRAINSLVTGGLIRIRTVRGRLGYTFAKLRDGARMLSASPIVPERGTPVERRTESGSLFGNNSTLEAARRPGWSSLSDALGGLAR